MDGTSEILIFLSIIGFILLLVILVSLFYKPARRLSVKATLSKNEENKPSVHVSVENIGKKRVRIMPPYIKFYAGIHSQIYQVAPKIIHHDFPRLLKRREIDECEIELSSYLEKLKKADFHATRFKILIKNSTGLEYFSPAIELHE
jgi:hypothetical protein